MTLLAQSWGGALLLLFLTGLCLACVLTAGLVHLLDQRDGRGVNRPAERRPGTSGEQPPSRAVGHPVSERRIADESRKLIEEVEHFLADPRSS